MDKFNIITIIILSFYEIENHITKKARERR